MITAAQLLAIAPRCPEPELYASVLSAAMAEGHIGTVTEAAAFLAHVTHETGEFRWMREIADGSAYEGRKSLGNVEPGDGRRFSGRGFIMLTGRANYHVASMWLGEDLVANPELAEEPARAARIAVGFWNSRNLSQLAAQRDFRAITKAINGGYTHYEQRLEYYHRALEVLGVTAKLEA